MHSLAAIDDVEPPRLARAVSLQALAVAGAALIAARPWPRRERAPAPPPEPKKEERRIRVVQLPRPPPAPRLETAQPRPQPPAAKPLTAPPRAASAPAPAQAPPLARIAADSTAMHGVRMRVLVPRNPAEPAAHLRNAAARLVVPLLDAAAAAYVSL